MGSVIGGVLGYSSSKKQAKAAESAADTQAEATRYASDMQKDMFNEVRADQKPYMEAGNQALSGLMGLTGLGGVDTAQLMKQDPSYQFRLNQGLDGVQSGAAAQGNLLSGATQKALMNYGQDYASQEYSNAFNRLSSITGMGQNAAAGVGNAGMQTSQAMANNTMAGANAQAAGTIGAANARAQGTQALGGALGGLIGGVAGMYI